MTRPDRPARDHLLTCGRVSAAAGLPLALLGTGQHLADPSTHGVTATATWSGVCLLGLGLLLSALRSSEREGFRALLVLVAGWGVARYAIFHSPTSDVDAEPPYLFGLGLLVGLPFALLEVCLVALVGLTVAADRAARALMALHGVLLAAFVLWTWATADSLYLSAVRPQARPWLLVSLVVLLLGTFLANRPDRYRAPHAVQARPR